MQLKPLFWSAIAGVATGAVGVAAFSLKVMGRRPLIFFPARIQQQIPSEMYHNFVSSMKDNYDIHFATNDVNQNRELLTKLNGAEQVCLVAHSSGASDLLNMYDSLDTEDKDNVNKLVLIEPIDFDKYNVDKYMEYFDINNMMGFDFDIDLDALNSQVEALMETNYLELIKNKFLSRGKATGATASTNQNAPFCDILVLKHRQSSKWRFVPTIPPLATLQTNLDQRDGANIKEIIIDEFSHFDLLDRPWANIMNRATMNDEKECADFTTYFQLIDEYVDDFYSAYASE